MPESEVILNSSVVTCGKVAKLEGMSEGHKWRGWAKSWVLVVVDVDVWGGLVVRRRKSRGWLFVGIGQKLFFR